MKKSRRIIVYIIVIAITFCLGYYLGAEGQRNSDDYRNKREIISAYENYFNQAETLLDNGQIDKAESKEYNQSRQRLDSLYQAANL